MDLEFLRCKNKHWVPILNGTLLHSSVDPVKEAALWVEKEWAYVKDAKNVIVLGLGGGFHIQELINRGKNNILVIEGSRELVLAMTEKNPDLMRLVVCLGGVPPGQLCHETELLEHMAGSFAILKHPASIRVNPFYYTPTMQVLTERSFHALKEMAKENSGLTAFFNTLDLQSSDTIDLPTLEKAMIKRGTGLDREGLIWMTLRELVK